MSKFVGHVLTGSEFKKNFTGPFYKFLNNNFIHNNFTYKIGLNIDIEEFNPTGVCQKGGLYFCDMNNCNRYYVSYGNYLAQIDIPDNAKVYMEEFKFKADRLIVNTITHFENVDDNFWSNIIKHEGCGFVLKYIKNQTNAICERAVQQNDHTLIYVKEQTERICELAVQKNSMALIYVNNQTKRICELAVHKNSMALRYVRDQTFEICLMAIRQDRNAYKYIDSDLMYWRVLCYDFINRLVFVY
jgi:hypothetical protein